MTFSILARNPETGEIGGAAATGNLCVGGWVLRGDIKKGCLLYTSPSPRDRQKSRMPSSA